MAGMISGPKQILLGCADGLRKSQQRQDERDHHREHMIHRR
jgi:hypothetical protein